jgi:hypothetical protein
MSMACPGIDWSPLEAELAAMAAQLRVGMDVAPGRRARFDGVLQHLLSQGLCTQAELLQRLGADGCVQVTDDRVEFALWQRRAPVVPSTQV